MITNVSELNSADYNPRKISERALEGLKFSLSEFGDISGIVYNSRTKNLVAGHQRVRALREKYGNELVVKENKIITPNNEEFNIRVVDWALEKEKAANIAANADTIQGTWTEDVHLLVDEISLDLPDVFSSLRLIDLEIPEINVNEQTIDVERQKSEIPQELRNSLKFGEITVYLSDEELEMLTIAYENFIEKNRTNFGFIFDLLKGKR